MTKKLFFGVFIGVIVLFASACGGGSKQSGSETGSVDAEDPNKSFYHNSVFLGDSLLLGLSDVLGDSNVIANAGATALFAIEKVDKIADKKPKHIYIMLGSDDLLMPVDNPKKDYLENYAKLIKKIKGKIPNVQIHVISVPPVTTEAMEREPRYKNISDYNEGLEKLAVTEKIDYIDLSSIFEEQQNLYGKDGIHFEESFYPLFLDHIKEHIDFSDGVLE
ncbi:GDSL-type esterase/lipase family protein [Sporosarcina sp. FSL K6-2383]|uniref:GDSL-type esterase/lipase family protein n=1 Tax=Sporosarcina sp. FSL K6-2383 TaxID=2921556 RepID=UPI003159E03D